MRDNPYYPASTPTRHPWCATGRLEGGGGVVGSGPETERGTPSALIINQMDWSSFYNLFPIIHIQY